MDNPTPQEIILARITACHSTAQAAKTMGLSVRAWQQYEQGKRRMMRPVFDLYLMRTSHHPTEKIMQKTTNDLIAEAMRPTINIYKTGL